MKSLVLKIADHLVFLIDFTKNYLGHHFSKSNKMTKIDFRKECSFWKVINSSYISFKIDEGKLIRSGYILEINATSISTP